MGGSVCCGGEGGGAWSDMVGGWLAAEGDEVGELSEL